jgi:hypothetical protein
MFSFFHRCISADTSIRVTSLFDFAQGFRKNRP